MKQAKELDVRLTYMENIGPVESVTGTAGSSAAPVIFTLSYFPAFSPSAPAVPLPQGAIASPTPLGRP
jgi:hypothetical protein